MDDLKLELNHTYLLRYGSSDTVHSVKILMITDKAYKICWNGGGESWELKWRMYSDYTLVEDITNHIVNKEIKDFKNNNEVKFYFSNTEVKLQPFFYLEENCKTCGGERKIPDLHSTGCYKTCPACNGTGKQSKKIQIFTE